MRQSGQKVTSEQRKNYTHGEDIAGGRETQWGHQNSSAAGLGNSMFGTFKGATVTRTARVKDSNKKECYPLF